MASSRRLLLVLGASSLGTPPAAFAQRKASLRRIAFLVPSTPASYQHLMEVLRSELRGLGWIEGDNLILEMRYAHNDPQRVVSLTAELLALKPDLFVSGTDREARAAAASTASVPIVFMVGVDPVGLGVVKSLARPGANVTGISVLLNELNPKRLSLLKETIPRLEKVGVLFREGEPSNAAALAVLETSARKIGVKLRPAGVGSSTDLDAAFAELARWGATGVLNVAHSLFFQHRQQLAELARRRRMAMIVNTSEMADAGALLSYGADLKVAAKRLGPLIDRRVRRRCACGADRLIE